MGVVPDGSRCIGEGNLGVLEVDLDSVMETEQDTLPDRGRTTPSLVAGPRLHAPQ